MSNATTIAPHLIPADYDDAINNAGWRTGRQSYERGYVSRKATPGKAKLCQTARGEWYVRLAAYNTSRYCIRQYLIP